MVATQSLTQKNTADWLFDTEGVLWVVKAYLVDTIRIDLNTVETGCSRFKNGKSASWAYERKDGAIWLVYEKLSAEAKQLIESHIRYHYKGVAADIYGVAQEAILKHRFITNADPSDDARFYMSLPAKKYGRAFSQSEADDLATACKILRGVQGFIDSTDYAKGVFVGKTKVVKTANEFIEHVAKLIKSWQVKSLKIGNGRVLRRKLQTFRDDGREGLLSDKLGNDNAQKITDDIERTAVVLSGSPFRNTGVDIRMELESRYGLTLSNATVNNLLRKPENQYKIKAVREGKTVAMKQQTIHIAQGKLRYADEMWLVDGTTVQLAVMDDKGKSVKIPMNRISVMDAYSKKRVGVAYGVTETADLVWEAMYFAFKTTGRLPNFLKSDNGGANTRADLVAKYKLLGITHITITPHRSTAQRDIEHDQHQHERMLQRTAANFTGGNFLGRGKQMRVNVDNLKRLQREQNLPTWLQAIAHDYEVFFSTNSMPDKHGRTPNQKYADSHHDNRWTCSTKDLVNVFDPLESPTRMEHGTIQFQNGGQSFQYWVGTAMEVDLEFVKRHNGNKFRVRFNPSDPSVIGLYTERWEFVSVAVQKHAFSPNPKALTSDERTALNKNLKGDKALRQWGVEAYNELKQATEAKGELSHIDFMTRLKEAVQKDELNTLWEDVDKVGILDSGRTRLQSKTQRQNTPSVIEQKAAHFFANDELAQQLLD